MHIRNFIVSIVVLFAIQIANGTNINSENESDEKEEDYTKSTDKRIDYSFLFKSNEPLNMFNQDNLIAQLRNLPDDFCEFTDRHLENIKNYERKENKEHHKEDEEATKKNISTSCCVIM